VSHIEGSTDENDITNKFAEYFSSFDFEFNSVIDNGIDTLNECDEPVIPVKGDEWLLNIEEVDSAVKNHLKLGKAAGIDTRAGGCVVTHAPLTPTARVQLPVALSSLTQAIILSWVGEMCSN